jgi:hypothetical protein
MTLCACARCLHFIASPTTSVAACIIFIVFSWFTFEVVLPLYKSELLSPTCARSFCVKGGR